MTSDPNLGSISDKKDFHWCGCQTTAKLLLNSQKSHTLTEDNTAL